MEDRDALSSEGVTTMMDLVARSRSGGGWMEEKETGGEIGSWMLMDVIIQIGLGPWED